MIVPLRSIFKSIRVVHVRLTAKRLTNLFKIYSSMIVSYITRIPFIWGYPPIVMIEPTNICNLRCPMCPSGNGMMKRKKGYLDLEKYENLIEDIGDYLIQIQLWNQGEPFLHNSFTDLIRKAKEKGIMIQTSTNGHFIRSDEQAKALIQSGLDVLIFSLDGTNQETYEKYRVGGNYQQVLQALSKISRLKKQLNSKTPLIELQFLVFKHNQDEMDELISLAKELSINRLSFKSAQIYTREQGTRFLPENQEYNRYILDDRHYQIKGRLRNWCRRLWLNPAINWDGTVSPCCFDKDAEHAFANIFHDETSFRQVWGSEEFQIFRRQILRDRSKISICQNCTEGLPEPYTRIVELTDLK